jgi:hypothetical protein
VVEPDAAGFWTLREGRGRVELPKVFSPLTVKAGPEPKLPADSSSTEAEVAMSKRSNPAVRIAQETAHNAVFDAEGNPKPGVHNMLLRAVEIQRPLVLAYVRRLQRKHPRASAAKLAEILERDYLRAVTGGGAIVGATAVVPGVGTVASLGLSAAATVGFLEATALYATSIAELHGIRLTNPEKASTMVMAIMLGEEGTALLGTLSGQAIGKGTSPTQAWGNPQSKTMPTG